MDNSYKNRIQDGLTKMRKVLYHVSNNKMQSNIIIWTKNAVNDLLCNKWVTTLPESFDDRTSNNS